MLVSLEIQRIKNLKFKKKRILQTYFILLSYSTTNKEDEISVASFKNAFGFIEFSEQAIQIFSQITDLDKLNEYGNGEEHIEQAKKLPEIAYSENLQGLVEQLEPIFGDEAIGTFR